MSETTTTKPGVIRCRDCNVIVRTQPRVGRPPIRCDLCAMRARRETAKEWARAKRAEANGDKPTPKAKVKGTKPSKNGVHPGTRVRSATVPKTSKRAPAAS